MQAVYSSAGFGAALASYRMPLMARVNVKSVPAGHSRVRGAKIKAARVGLGESQPVFGDRFGVQQGTVSRWERGYPPERVHWAPLAPVVGGAVAEIFGALMGNDAERGGINRLRVN